MKKVILFFVIFFLNLIHFQSFSQGCSDAGFCTLGALRPNQPYSKKVNLKLRSIEISNYFGITQKGSGLINKGLVEPYHIFIYNISADLNVSISNKITAQIKLPYQFVSGRLANTNGLGDISLSASYNIIAKEKFQVNGSIGMKIPTGNANNTKNETLRNGTAKDLPLPMYYQTSLGTWDILGGISLMSKNWLFATGFQQVLTNTPNNFLWKPYDQTPDSSLVYHYMKSKNLRRGTDVMFRVERNFRFSNWNVYAGILTILRLTKDTFLDGDNKIKQIDGSNGPAITALFGAGYRFDTHSGIKAMFGYNLMDRKVTQNFKENPIKEPRNPDGLSRLMVFTLGYEYRF